MFGFLRARRLDLTLRQIQEQQAYYCGLCHSLRDEYGLLTRALANRDGTFLAMLIDAQRNAQPVYENRRCIVNVSKRRAVQSSSATRFAAASTVVLVHEKLADDVADEGGLFPKLMVRLLRDPAEHARRDLESMGFPTQLIDEKIAEQCEVEQSPPLSLDDMCEPTASGMGALLAYTAQLSGSPKNRETLRCIGSNLGKLIYLLDAYSDYFSDVQCGQFNAFAAWASLGSRGRHRGTKAPERISWQMRRTADEVIAQIEADLSSLVLIRHQDYIRNVLTLGLRDKVERLSSRFEFHRQHRALTWRQLLARPKVLWSSAISALTTTQVGAEDCGEEIGGLACLLGLAYCWCQSKGGCERIAIGECCCRPCTGKGPCDTD